MLFGVPDAGGQIAGQAVSPQCSTVFRTPGDLTSQILQDTQNIRPIVRVNQGTELAITVAKDFDFSQVYGMGLNCTRRSAIRRSTIRLFGRIEGRRYGKAWVRQCGSRV